jgi:hypothetical protein
MIQNLKTYSNIYFIEFVNYAKLKFDEYNLKVLKAILLVLKDINGKNSNDDFGLKSCFNGLQKVYRKDLIFTLLSNKNILIIMLLKMFYFIM